MKKRKSRISSHALHIAAEAAWRGAQHPPSLSPDDIAQGHLRHLPIGSKITGSRPKSSVDDKPAIAA